ncbi:MAG: PQQ-dependent dehydrogenase, methanol/ethanol family [Caulobacterales bacterium]|nr:PQQ-dependent dehydrogenase, methanol/ethanol family [Caulobacterales bacterium]
MYPRDVRGAAPALLAILLAACGADAPTPPEAPSAPAPAESRGAAGVDGALLADPPAADWPGHGRGYGEQRFSPLDQINADTVADLSLAWRYDLPTNRGIEATPIVVDGVMYTTGAWSIVYALDAETGELLWDYDPEVPLATGAKACCDVVNRGAAVWKGRVYVGALDGRLIALDAETGERVWQTDTLEGEWPYTITGAPRVVKDKVVIGNGGADYGARGYVSAYDADTGALAWRFYTVPGDPADGFEDAAMEMAAGTWSGRWWTLGGGGTVWDSIAYDPDLDLLYIGVGNGGPFPQAIRSPGGGDNLFLSSIVALRPDTGEYVWHYQTTPGDIWDYTATQHIMQAELEIDGAPRRVLMQAPKNGFFYVLDRATGELISAEPFVTVTWASHVDPDTGRPVENPEARYAAGDPPVVVSPSPFGGHNWHPMAFHPGHGLVYIPAREMPGAWVEEQGFAHRPGILNLGVDFGAVALPEEPAALDAAIKDINGQLIAWDPVAQRARWRHREPGAWNGGVLATAGNLVFQGQGDGRFVAFAADSGEELWSADAQTGLVAGPVSYEIDGEQYVTVMAGWGGTYSLVAGPLAERLNVRNVSRVLTYKLGGTASLPPLPPPPEPFEPPAMPEGVEQARIDAGRSLYTNRCSACHGAAVAGGGTLPDLRHSSPAVHDGWAAIVLDGEREVLGMPGFAGVLDVEEAEAVRLYVLKRAHDWWAENRPGEGPAAR